MSKSLWCRLGIHRWETRRNEEGQRYITCQRCLRAGAPARLSSGRRLDRARSDFDAARADGN